MRHEATESAVSGTCGPAGPGTASPRRHRHRRPGGLSRHGRRLTSFSAVGALVFVAGLAFQWLLVRAGTGADGSYAGQAAFSILLSFVLNWRFTWRDRDARFWLACWEFCLQKTLLTVPNLALYALLVQLGSGWLAGNVATTVVFTLANYVLADKWVFVRPARITGVTAADGFMRSGPAVSVIVPCKGNEQTIRATVDALLGQDYQALEEVILVGSTGDTTWTALSSITDPRLVILEQELTPGTREPNVKRDKGLRKASGELLALADSDIVMAPDWLSTAVPRLLAQGGGVVAGGMKSIHDSFWGRFVDRNVLAAKTPRLSHSYQVTAANFGRRGTYPPITANAVFTRDVYESEPLDVTWSYGYEDYEWFWRVARAGHTITFAPDISGAHHHRRSFRRLATEYRWSANGCAHFIRAHPASPLARKRRRQALLLPVAASAGAALAGVTAASRGAVLVAFIAACAMLALAGREVATSRRLEAAVYPLAGLALAAVFTWGLSSDLLMRRNVVHTKPDIAPLWDKDEPAREPLWRRAVRRISWPLTAILSLQAIFSLSLVWSNTAFADEANYLWQGRLEWAHWVHGSTLPAPVLHDSGIPQIYPPIGALASSIGGLAGARILSLFFMLTATVLLYLIAVRIFDFRTALMACALWAVSEPVLRLTFATYDPLACLLVILSLWLSVQAAVRFRRGELIALSAIILALAAGTAFSFAIMLPVVVAVAFFYWQSQLGTKPALWCAGWLTGSSIFLTLVLLTASHSWTNVIGSTITRGGAGSVSLGYGISSVVSYAWSWDGTLFAIALAGAVASFIFERLWSRRFLVVSLVIAGIVVPAYQAHLGSGWSLDKHMSAGTGFMAIGAGYLFSKINLSAWKPAAIICAASAILSFPALTGLWYARNTFHSWPNTAELISFLSSHGQSSTEPDLVTGQSQAAFWAVQFYLPGLPIVEASSPAEIEKAAYPRIVLALDASLDSVALPKDAASGRNILANEVLRLAAGNQGEYPLTIALEHSLRYRIVSVIPYSTIIASDASGLFVVWQRVQ